MPEVDLDCRQPCSTAYPMLWFSDFSARFLSVHLSFQWRLQCGGSKGDTDGLHSSPGTNVKSGQSGTWMLTQELGSAPRHGKMSQAKNNSIFINCSDVFTLF